MLKAVYERQACMRVAFSFPTGSVAYAKTVHIVGDFNSWNNRATPMQETQSCSFIASIDLMPGKEYEFLYLIDRK